MKNGKINSLGYRFGSCSFRHRIGAQNFLKRSWRNRSENLNAACIACHFEEKEKTERNDFGQLFHKEFEEAGLELSKGWAELDGDRASQKEYEKEVMAPAFAKAWEEVKKMKPMKDGEEVGDETYEQLVANFKLEGLREKKKKK